MGKKHRYIIVCHWNLGYFERQKILTDTEFSISNGGCSNKMLKYVALASALNGQQAMMYCHRKVRKWKQCYVVAKHLRKLSPAII